MPQHRNNTNPQESEQNNNRLQYIGSYIRELRLMDRLTQVEAAERINISIGTIQRIENGNNVTLETLFKISDAYDIQIADFFYDLD